MRKDVNSYFERYEDYEFRCLLKYLLVQIVLYKMESTLNQIYTILFIFLKKFCCLKSINIDKNFLRYLK